MIDVKKALLLYAVSDRGWTGEKTLVQQIEDALKGGITMLQLREKELGYDDFLEEAMEIKALCSKYDVPLIINDNVDIAIKCGADGVHVGQSDTDAAEARRLLGRGKIIGVTAKTPEQAVLAERAGADYLGVGAMFSTSTKLDTSCIGPDALGPVAAAVSIPVCAIGGINMDNMRLLKGRGAAGVALVSAIFSADDITQRSRELLALAGEVFG